MSTEDLVNISQLTEISDNLVYLFELGIKENVTLYAYSDSTVEGQAVYFPSLIDTGQWNTYLSLPIQAEGFEWKSDGPSARPTLTIANIVGLAAYIDDFQEESLKAILEANEIYSNEDLLGKRVTIRRTLASKLETTPQAAGTAPDPVEFPVYTFILDRVSEENKLIVSFELASPFDVEGVRVPGRILTGKYCTWKYQGYSMETNNVPGGGGGCNWDLDSKGRFYDIDDNLIQGTANLPGYSAAQVYTPFIPAAKSDTGVDIPASVIKTSTNGHVKIWQAIRKSKGKHPETGPAGYWTRLDTCGKTLNSCKVRFHGTDKESTEISLPFGAFPGTRTFR